MTFNKYLPDARPQPAPSGPSPVFRALLLRSAWYVSLGMLVLGYVLIWKYWAA